MKQSKAHAIHLNRTLVLKHPNAIECAVFRQHPANSKSEVPISEAGLGGERYEEKIDWEDLGYGMILLIDHMSSSESCALIASTAAPNEAGYYTPERYDIVVLLIHDKVKISYEVLNTEIDESSALHAVKYILNRRSDLDSF